MESEISSKDLTFEWGRTAPYELSKARLTVGYPLAGIKHEQSDPRLTEGKCNPLTRYVL